ncbi:hypothetical protein FHS57_004770 [Runella defluvii]|uniref:Uncharacterized protein n=1 Tax=Runella defluvii TaxID=370973 RepID=A0A7W6ESI2_9BACT|nr:hypothetical protein [Runella defluvii]MBB3840750.1 hypothetical protein [Runella defluvii]
MEYQVTKPSFVRVNWTQVAFTFAACFAACLLAGGALYAVTYFINRKQKVSYNGNDTQTRQQRPLYEKEKHVEIKKPQIDRKEIDEINDEIQTEEIHNKQEKKLDGKIVQLKTIAEHDTGSSIEATGD